MHRPKHILFDCERMKFAHTGLYYYCLQLGTALLQAIDKERESIDFYTPRSAGNIFGDDVQYVRQSSLQKFILPQAKKYSAWHATFQGTMYFPFRKNIPIVFTVHDINFMHDDYITRHKKKKYLKQLEKKIERADFLVFISRYTSKDVQRYIDLKNKPHVVIYNGCNITGVEHPEMPIVLPKKKFLFTIGTIAPNKNFHVLPQLLQNNELLLIISGIVQNESYKQKIIEEAKKWKAENRLIFTGPVSENDKIWYLKNCEAFAFPSLAEGFGLPVIEAMRFGKPLLLSKLSSLPEIGGDLAHYFESFDPVHMQAVLQQAMQQNNNLTIADELKKRALTFDWLSAAKEYLAIYRSLY